MITMPSTEQNTETAVHDQDTAQDTEQVASVKLDEVTGGWGWYGPGPGPYGAPPWAGHPGGPYSPYAAAAFDRRAAWYAANSPRYAGWWY